MTSTDWLTLALVVITAFYAWATFRILRANEAVVAAMQAQTEAQLRPYVIAYAAPRIGTTLMCLHIENQGRSAAQNLRLTMDKNFYPNAEKNEHENLAKLSAFKEPIRSLAPGARITFNLGVGHKILRSGPDDLCPQVFSVHAEYDLGTKHYTDNNTVDLRPLVHSAVVFDPVAQELEKLRKALEGFVNAKREA
jgi:hypothetical protein